MKYIKMKEFTAETEKKMKYAPCVPGTGTCSVCGCETSTVNVGGEHFCYDCLAEAEMIADEETVCPICNGIIAAGDRVYLLNGSLVCGDCVDDAIDEAGDIEVKCRNDAVEAIGRQLDAGENIPAKSMQFFYNYIHF